MYTKIILAAVAAVELFYLVWDLKAKTTHKKAKVKESVQGNLHAHSNTCKKFKSQENF